MLHAMEVGFAPSPILPGPQITRPAGSKPRVPCFVGAPYSFNQYLLFHLAHQSYLHFAVAVCVAVGLRHKRQSPWDWSFRLRGKLLVAARVMNRPLHRKPDCWNRLLRAGVDPARSPRIACHRERDPARQLGATILISLSPSPRASSYEANALRT